MLVLRDRVIDTPIMSLQTGGMIAHTEKAIIDPRSLAVVAFYCAGPMLDVDPAILHTSDIRETGPMGFIVDNSDKIMSPEDLVRLQEVIDLNFQLDNKPVIDDTGRKVGHVVDYAVDTDSFLIIKLHVRPGLLQAFQIAEVIIDRQQIVKVSDKHIVVKSPTIKVREPVKTTHTGNPFRAAHPQPDMIEHVDNH